MWERKNIKTLKSVVWENMKRKKSRSFKLWCTTTWANAFTVTLPTSKCKRTQSSFAATIVAPSTSLMPQNPNFEILKLCIIVSLYISSLSLYHIFHLLNASKTLILRFWNCVLLIFFIFHLFYLSYFAFPISLMYTFFFQ